jgi:hypothetical protein
LTQPTINTLVWIVSTALQLALFLALLLRGIAHRFPLFTTLIGFYLLRSALLFLIFDHLALPSYRSLYDLLQLIDLLAQTAVAIEIILHLIRTQGGPTLPRILIPIGLVILATIGTLLTAAVLPAHAPIPIDRTQIFFSFLMILLFARALSIPSSSALIRRITAGFALYGIVNVSANLGRTYAAIHNNAPLYATWSYILAGVYLVVVLFWLLTLQRPQNAAAL